MKKQTKLLSIFIAFAIIVSTFTTQATKLLEGHASSEGSGISYDAFQ